jgi:hypothetical protein
MTLSNKFIETLIKFFIDKITSFILYFEEYNIKNIIYNTDQKDIYIDNKRRKLNHIKSLLSTVQRNFNEK